MCAQWAIHENWGHVSGVSGRGEEIKNNHAQRRADDQQIRSNSQALSFQPHGHWRVHNQTAKFRPLSRLDIMSIKPPIPRSRAYKSRPVHFISTLLHFHPSTLPHFSAFTLSRCNSFIGNTCKNSPRKPFISNTCKNTGGRGCPSFNPSTFTVHPFAVQPFNPLPFNVYGLLVLPYPRQNDSSALLKRRAAPAILARL